MCIAIFSESGVGYPTKEIFERCWINNDDGAGWAYLTDDNKWYIRKGFMTFDEFWEAWEKEAFDESNTVAIHLRWATSGKEEGSGKKKENGKKMYHPGCTHPFPITDDRLKLFETEILSESICMHNGVVGAGKGDLSDTMVSILDHIDPLLPYIKDDKKVKDLLIQLLDAEGYTYSSRWFVAHGAKTYLFGDWIHDEETKIYYSKDEYLEPKEWEYRNEIHPWYSQFAGDQAPKESGRPTDVRFFEDLTAEQFLTKKLKMWSWTKWKEWEDTEDPTLNAGMPADSPDEDDHPGYPTPDDLVDEETTTTCGYDGQSDTIEVYNAKNEVIALIDPATGESVWEKEPKLDGKEVRHCNDCGASVSRAATDDGLCPFCYSPIFSNLTSSMVAEEETAECPECYEKNYLIDSTFPSKGDSECCRCGCLFWSTIKGKEGIAGCNEDTRAVRLEILESLDDNRLGTDVY